MVHVVECRAFGDFQVEQAVRYAGPLGHAACQPMRESWLLQVARRDVHAHRQFQAAGTQLLDQVQRRIDHPFTEGGFEFRSFDEMQEGAGREDALARGFHRASASAPTTVPERMSTLGCR